MPKPYKSVMRPDKGKSMAHSRKHGPDHLKGQQNSTMAKATPATQGAGGKDGDGC